MVLVEESVPVFEAKPVTMVELEGGTSFLEVVMEGTVAFACSTIPGGLTAVGKRPRVS